jgi:hypothetical protein
MGGLFQLNFMAQTWLILIHSPKIIHRIFIEA